MKLQNIVSHTDQSPLASYFLQPPQEKLPESAAVSPLSWLGIHPETGFDLIQEHELQQVAAIASELCTRVVEQVRQVPVLLEGLSHNIPEDVDDLSHSPLQNIR